MSEIPARLVAAFGDRYRLIEELGAGGMATVYLADDLKHERKVAVKVLRPELAAVIGGERFITEIKTTAGLQHPHILPLFDSGEADSFLYYVMPYVEGESLRQRLDRERQLEVDEALHITRAVASALQYAHERDIIHRDIKPENILLHAGEPVVADFGIALAISAAGGGRLTETGLSLGTPHYMSPEQAAADRDLSARSDVYSLACVLYEMLAGQPPHTGPSAQSILVRILTEDPRPVAEARPTVPRHIRAVVDRGLEKLPADRFKSAEEFRAALDDETFTHERVAVTAGVRAAREAAAAEVPGSAPGGFRPGLVTAAVVPVVALAMVLGWVLGRGNAPASAAPDGPVVSFVMADSVPGAYPKVGPDGTLAYLTRGVLYARPPGALEATPLVDLSAGTVDWFTFSPDGEWIAYSTSAGEGTSTTLHKMPVGGGSSAVLWTVQDFILQPVWADDGNLYLTTVGRRHLLRLPDVGGEPESIFDTGGSFIPLPTGALPEGRALLFSLVTGGGGGGGVTLLDLSTGDTVTVAADGFDGRWSPTGHVVYGHQSGALWAVSFDARELVPLGQPAPVQDGVAVQPPFLGHFDVGPSGVLAYVAGAAAGQVSAGIRFSLVDEEGNGETLPLEPTDHADAGLSPDGTRLAYTRDDDIWVYDLDLGTNDSLTSGGTGQHNPVWSPDGTRIVYRTGDEVAIRPVDRSEEPTVIAGIEGGPNPGEWTEDEGILLSTDRLDGNADIFAVSEDHEVRPILQADWNEEWPRVSPHGRWVAYASARRGGQSQMYVRSWPELRNEVQISEAPRGVPFGSPPQWSPDGGTLYYVQDNLLWAAAVDTAGGFRVTDRRTTGLSLPPGSGILDVMPDGRILMYSTGTESPVEEVDEGEVDKLVVVANWFRVLRERLGEGGG